VAREDLDPDRLKSITSDMVEALTSPAYVEAMRVLKSTSNEKRLSEAMRRLNPDALRAEGVKLPEGMRISSRYFEPAFKPIELSDEPKKRNYLKDLYDTDPELVDRLGGLRGKNPALFEELADKLSGGDISPLAFCACACGGAAVACGGLGAG